MCIRDRPTALVDTGDVRKVPTAQIDRRPGTDELLARLALEPHSTWEVKDGDRVMGPLAFPTLVQKILSGEVPLNASIRKDKGPPVPGTEVPELQRYIGSKALAFDTDELRKATATGRLEDGSLLALTCRLAKERRTGLVSLRDLAPGAGGATMQRKKKVYFVDGRPDFVSSNDPGELLGEHLVRSGVCVRMEVDMALAMLPRFGGRLGDALVRMGILTPAQLYSAIASQVRTRYLEAFRWKTGSWCYVPDLKAGEETVPLREGVPDLLRAAAEAADLGVVTGALRPLRDRMLSPGLMPPFPMSVYGARASWQEVVSSVRGGTTLSGTVTQHTQGGRRDPEEVYRAIWFGLSTELLRAA